MSRTLVLAALGAAAALAPISASPTAPREMADGMLFKLHVTCAAAQEEIIGDGGDFANSGCAPAYAYVCTTPTKDYVDKRPI